jgi:molybdopterin biosynthesis enzyme
VLKKVKIEDAVGLVIGHDMTRVVPGEFAGPAFRRGHIVREEDIPQLKQMGKEHIYVIDMEENEVHEEEAALRIARAISGDFLEWSSPKEGRVNIKSQVSGLLKVNISLLKQVNSLGDIVVTTRQDNTACEEGDIVAATKIIPLYTTENKLEKLETICKAYGNVIEVKPFLPKKFGVVVTGNEVYSGLIEDGFVDLIARKVSPFGCDIVYKKIVPDDEAVIAQAIVEARDRGSEVICVCGGLSVDPDDVTVEGVKHSGAEIVIYGVPVMPGAMFLYARLSDIPVLGLPAAFLHNETTVFDLILPRIMADEEIHKEDFIELGYGGLCLNCELCNFPICPFGK